MRRLLKGIFVALLSVSAYAQSSNFQSMIDQKTKAFMQNQGVPGAAIAIYYQGKGYLFTYGYSNKEKKIPVTNDTIFDLASVTKIFTTTLLATQIQAGKIKLSDPIIKYIPDLAKTQNLPVDQITVLRLATHTAGLPHQQTDLEKDKGNKSQLMQGLKQWKPTQAIGTHYAYSNVSFGLLGFVLEGATHQKYMDLMSTFVLKPLNMNHTVVDIPPNLNSLHAQGYNRSGLPAQLYQSTFLEGGGGLRSSIADMLNFLEANLNIPTANAPASLLQAMQFAQQAQFTVNPHFIMALGWQRILRNETLFITKNGSNLGFSTFIGFIPNKKVGVVILTNRSEAKAGQLGWDILQSLKNV